MTLEYHEYTNFTEWLDHEQAIKAFNYLKHFVELNDYDEAVVITVEGYKAVAKIINEFTPIEINENYIAVFDNERIYPIQAVKKAIEFVY